MLTRQLSQQHLVLPPLRYGSSFPHSQGCKMQRQQGPRHHACMLFHKAGLGMHALGDNNSHAQNTLPCLCKSRDRDTTQPCSNAGQSAPKWLVQLVHCEGAERGQVAMAAGATTPACAASRPSAPRQQRGLYHMPSCWLAVQCTTVPQSQDVTSCGKRLPVCGVHCGLEAPPARSQTRP